MNVLRMKVMFRQATMFGLFWCALLTIPAASAEELTVAVAANMKFAFGELQQAFSRQSGNVIKAVFGSSGKLTAQIESGAPFDVMLSADMKYPTRLYEGGLAVYPPKVYARGVLVLWTLNPFDLSNWQQLLREPSVKRIAVADPKLAPYGREAVRALQHFRLHEGLKGKLIYGESISQVNQFIDSRAADAGFTAKSVVLAPTLKEKGRWVELPRDSYDPILQGVVILKRGGELHARASESFLAFLASPAARTILEKYGYLIP